MVVAVGVLLLVSPSGSGELTVNAAVIEPATLATAGTVRLGALAPEASDKLRVQVIVPEQRGYPVLGTQAQLVPVGTAVMQAPVGTVNAIVCDAAAVGPRFVAVSV